MKQDYEYTVDAVQDEWKGGADLSKLQEFLNKRAREGWRLVTAITNELGKNAMSVSGFGVNATLDQTVLIFERPVVKKIDVHSDTKVYKNTNKTYAAVKVENFEIDKKGNGDKNYISVKGKLYKKCKVSAIKLNLVFESYWGDSQSLCLVFDEIVVDNQYSFESEFVELSPEFVKSLKSIYAEVIQYVEGEELNDNEIIESHNNGFNIMNYIDRFETMKTVKEIKDFMMGEQINAQEYVAVILPKMEELIKSERMFGSMKESFLKWLKENYN